MGIALREIFARFGIEFDSKELVEGFNATEVLTDSVRSLASELTAPALVIGAVHFTRQMAEMGQAMGDQARQWHMSATSMREWQYVAEASGLQVQEMDSALATLSQSARDSIQGDYDLAYTFRRIGVDVRDSNRELKDSGVLMDEVGQRLAQIERPRLRAQLANRLLGESARFIVPLFEDGGRAVHGLQEEIRGLVGGDIEEFTAQSRAARAEGARSRLAFEAMSNSLGLVLLPVVTRVTSTIGGAVAWFKKWADKSYILQSAVQVMSVVIIAALVKAGIAAAVAFGPAILAAMPFILLIGGLILLMDDLNALFNGGHSLIGEWVDAMFGADAAAIAVRGLKEEWEEIIDAVSRAIGVVAEFLGMTDRQAQGRLAPGHSLPNGTDMNHVRVGSALPGVQSAGGTLNVSTLQSADERRAHRAATRQGTAEALAEYRSMFGNPALSGAPGGVGSRSVPMGAARSSDVRLATTVGQIVVNPPAGADVTAIANEVHGRIRSAQREDLLAARRQLAPRAAGLEGLD